MEIKDVLLAFIVLCSSLSIHNGFGLKTISREEDLELEKQLKLLNKSAVTTIKTKYGDTYNCVDFYKQPAFDHPSLKNHTFDHFQMRHSSFPKGYKKMNSTKATKPYTNMWLNGKGCPIGTVPIRKMSKDDLIKAKLANQIFASNIHPLTKESPGYHYAIVRTKDRTKVFHGVGMLTSVYNPSVKEKQFSRGHLMIENGNERLNTGWMVNPSLYGDSYTRGFTYTSAGNSHCFNTLCPGLVSMRPDIPVDVVLTPTSERGGQIYEARFNIFQDKGNKHWFLYYPPDNEVVAFWPHQIFQTLNDHANYAEWGGAVYSPPDVESPPMGAGHYIKEDLEYDAYCSNIVTLDEEYKEQAATESEEYADIARVYKVKDFGNKGGALGHLLLFGGIGSYTGD